MADGQVTRLSAPAVAGLDWAAQPEHRAAASLHLGPDGSLSLTGLTAPLSDDQACEICRDPELAAVAVDIPFGWPAGFVDFVRAWNNPRTEPVPVPDYPGFCFRLTDHHIVEHLGKRPLSVSTDRIGVATRAWLQVVQRGGLLDQIDWGYGPARAARYAPLIEVYPGGTLAALFNCRPEVTHEKYRREPAVRRRLLEDLVERFRLHLNGREDRLLLPQRCDDLDALIAALTAAVYAGMVPGREIARAPAQLRSRVEREGWIFYPEPEGKFCQPHARRANEPQQNDAGSKDSRPSSFERVCPVCETFVFRRWPFGWDSHARRCPGLPPAPHEERKREFKSRSAKLFR